MVPQYFYGKMECVGFIHLKQQDLDCFNVIHKLKRKRYKMLAIALRLITSSSFQIFQNKKPILYPEEDSVLKQIKGSGTLFPSRQGL